MLARQLKGQSMNKPVSYFLGEGALIVFSILLALGVNEWRIKATDARNLNTAVTDLTFEITENIALFEGIPNYHRLIAKDLAATAQRIRNGEEDSTKTPLELFIGQENLRDIALGLEGPVQSISWQTSKDRNITAQLDYQTAKMLSAVYDQRLPSVEGLIAQITAMIGRTDMHKAEDQAAALLALSAVLTELAAREETLVWQFEKSLARLEKKYPEAVRAALKKNT